MENNTEARPPTPTDPEPTGATTPQAPAAPADASATSTGHPAAAPDESSAPSGGTYQAPEYPPNPYPAGGYTAAPYSPAQYGPGQYGPGQYGSGPYAPQHPAAAGVPGQAAGQYSGQTDPPAADAWSAGGATTTTALPSYSAPGYASPPTAPGTPGYGAPSYPPARRLTRSQDDRVLSGVLGGLARYWNTDPLLLRILTIVLTVATGGALLLGYIIAWIVIPLEPRSPNSWPGGTGYAAGGTPTYTPPGSTPEGTAQSEAAPRPPRSYLGWMVVSAGLILAGVLAVIGLLFEPTSGFAAFICAAVLIVLGAGLIAGAWYGRARWLTVLAVPMVFVTMAAVATNSWVQSPQADRFIASPDGGISVGSRIWTVTPTDTAHQPLEYQVTAGDAHLDLTQLTAQDGTEDGAPGQRVTVNAGVGLGQLMVTIPQDMQVNLAATVKAGAVAVPATRPDQAVVERNGTDLNVNTTIESVTDGQPAYVVDLDVAIGAGNVEVRRAAS